jgi:hypothetical protein
MPTLARSDSDVMKKLILERARQELSIVSECCKRAAKEIEDGSIPGAVERLSGVEGKLGNALNRLRVAQDAEHDLYLSPYLIEPTSLLGGQSTWDR